MGWGQGSSTGWRKTRQAALERDQYQCQLKYTCCTAYATEVDHVINLASTGHARTAVNVDDLQAVCHECHQRKTTREAVAGRRANRVQWRRTAEKHPGHL